jgi:putative transposase
MIRIPQRFEAEIRNSVFRAVAATTATRTEKRGRKCALSTAALLDRIFFVCKTGCPWRSLEVTGASAMTVYHHFNCWSKARVFERAFADMRSTYLHLPRASLIVDCSYVKNAYGQDVIGRNPTDRGRNATKVSLLADTRGAPLHTCFHKGNRADCQTLHHLLNSAAPEMGPLRTHNELLADKGYDSALCRSVCEVHGLQPLIPKRGTRGDRSQNSRRVRVEHVFGHLDKCRRILVRYDARMPAFRSFHALACLKVLSQVMWSPTRPHLLP